MRPDVRPDVRLGIRNSELWENEPKERRGHTFICLSGLLFENKVLNYECSSARLAAHLAARPAKAQNYECPSARLAARLAARPTKTQTGIVSEGPGP